MRVCEATQRLPLGIHSVCQSTGRAHHSSWNKSNNAYCSFRCLFVSALYCSAVMNSYDSAERKSAKRKSDDCRSFFSYIIRLRSSSSVVYYINKDICVHELLHSIHIIHARRHITLFSVCSTSDHFSVGVCMFVSPTDQTKNKIVRVWIKADNFSPSLRVLSACVWLHYICMAVRHPAQMLRVFHSLLHIRMLLSVASMSGHTNLLVFR